VVGAAVVRPAAGLGFGMCKGADIRSPPFLVLFAEGAPQT
jgi:hypothetical protein